MLHAFDCTNTECDTLTKTENIPEIFIRVSPRNIIKSSTSNIQAIIKAMKNKTSYEPIDFNTELIGK